MLSALSAPRFCTWYSAVSGAALPPAVADVVWKDLNTPVAADHMHRKTVVWLTWQFQGPGKHNCGCAYCRRIAAHRHVENDVVNTERCDLGGMPLRSRLVVWAVGLLCIPATLRMRMQRLSSRYQTRASQVGWFGSSANLVPLRRGLILQPMAGCTDAREVAALAAVWRRVIEVIIVAGSSMVEALVPGSRQLLPIILQQARLASALWLYRTAWSRSGITLFGDKQLVTTQIVQITCIASPALPPG